MFSSVNVDVNSRKLLKGIVRIKWDHTYKVSGTEYIIDIVYLLLITFLYVFLITHLVIIYSCMCTFDYIVIINPSIYYHSKYLVNAVHKAGDNYVNGLVNTEYLRFSVIFMVV